MPKADMADNTADNTAARDLLTLFDGSPTPYHCVATVADLLVASGFCELGPDRDVPRIGSCFVRSGGALVAWDLGEHHGPIPSVRAVCAHTDSPNLRVKPNPDSVSAGWRRIGVEIYGGVLLNSWLDRDLGLAGRVVVSDGDAHAARHGEVRLFEDRRPLLRVPQLAIHLDREITTRGLLLDRQQHMTPTWGTGDGPGFAEYLGEQVGVAPGDVVSWDAMAFDLTPALLAGLEEEFLVSGRIDNQLSCFVAARALATVQGKVSSHIPMICLFDHEEVGSVSATGAASPLVSGVLARIEATLGSTTAQRSAGRSASLVVSADGAHGTHPNYPERHDPDHPIAVNGGPVLKINHNQRYATDAITGAAFRLACRRAGVPVQTFVSRNDMACGSTIGPITAGRLGIGVVEVGCAQLAMHSAREMCGSHDPALFEIALVEMFRS